MDKENKARLRRTPISLAFSFFPMALVRGILELSYSAFQDGTFRCRVVSSMISASDVSSVSRSLLVTKQNSSRPSYSTQQQPSHSASSVRDCPYMLQSTTGKERKMPDRPKVSNEK